MMPDFIEPMIGLPAAIVACIIWRRQVVIERRRARR